MSAKKLTMSEVRRGDDLSDVDTIKQLKKKVARLESDNESMQRHVESARKANQTKFLSKQKTRRLKDDWVRVIIGDGHGSSIDKTVAAVLLNDLKTIEVDEIVALGDMMECGGFLAQHFTMGYVAQTEYTYEADIAAANQFFDNVMESCPKLKKFHYLEGNHEQRIEKWCVTQALRNKHDAEFLLRQIGTEHVLDLKNRGVDYYKQVEYYDGVSIPGTIKLGSCFFTHGITACKHAAANHAEKLGGNVVYGHTHRMDAWRTNTVSAGRIGAWSPGCLCKRQRMWHHTKPSMWSHGYLLQVVSRSGKFQTIPIEIENNQSMLAQFTRTVS